MRLKSITFVILDVGEHTQNDSINILMELLFVGSLLVILLRNMI